MGKHHSRPGRDHRGRSAWSRLHLCDARDCAPDSRSPRAGYRGTGSDPGVGMLDGHESSHPQPGPARCVVHGHCRRRLSAVGFESTDTSAPAGDAARTGPGFGGDLRQRRIHFLPHRPIAESALRLGNVGNQPREDEGGPGAPRRHSPAFGPFVQRSAQRPNSTSMPMARTRASRRCKWPGASPHTR